MKKKNQLMLAVALTASVFFTGCSKDSDTSATSQDQNISSQRRTSRKFYGPAVHIGNGAGRVWISEDQNGNPTGIGINLTERALNSLPEQMTSWVLYPPRQGATNFYKHIAIDWNPMGHEPMAIYGIPHFDFHFYTISNDERMMIGPNDTVQFANAPASQYVPPMYIQTPGGVPMMGAHWIDVTSPELNGAVFTKTFIWGSYDGDFIFWEPMVTRDYLLTHPNDEVTLAQPAAYQHDGWYPQKYAIDFDGNEYSIALTNLAYHQGQ